MTDEPTASAGPSYVVGVGASAGGLEALVSFFSALPPDSDMAFVVVQHLSPDHKSLMVELLAKHTGMPVQHATDGMPVQPNHVYLIPPSKNITIYHGALFLADQDRTLGHINFPIDLFFDSLAEDQGDKAVAVVLSGTGSDGTRGIGVVKDKGGLILVQDPETAQYGGMPRSAIRSGHVDRVLAPDAIPKALLKFVEAPLQARAALQPDSESTTEGNGFAKIRSLLRHEYDLDFSAYKPSTFIRRIRHRMNIHQLEGVTEYAEQLRTTPRELQLLHRDLLIGVTRFFRDPEAFHVLEEQVVPRVVDAALNRQVPAIRVWVAGCSTGEEAYSIAILFHEYLQGVDHDVDLKIFATDADQEAISRAASGAYPDSTIADLSLERQRAFFVKIGSQYQITRELRGSVIFAPHNLLKDPPFSKLDLISCRNLLIYLKPETQEHVLANFSYALSERGFLFLGSSESITGKGLGFTAVSAKHRIYQQQRSMLTRPQRPLDASAYRRGQIEADTPQPSTAQTSELVNGLFQGLLNEYVPAAVLVNADKEVMHVFGNVNRYMRVASGEAKMDLLAMVQPSIKMLVGTALHKAKKDDGRVVYPDVPLDDSEETARFDLVVETEEVWQGEDVFLIIFDDTSTEAGTHYAETARSYNLDQAAQDRIEDLDRKLRYTEENLQATVEELETSNEELQATNEELMAANEELQSTNEELHSVNEELVTVNAELQEKIRQLTELNSDMNNLLQSTEVSTIFLDTELRIRKFTDAAADYVNLLPSDEGRPIHHFSHVFEEVDLHACAQDVLENNEPIEQEAKSDSDRWYRFRALPYLTPDDVVKGVVLTFEDITEPKTLRGALSAERQRRRAVEAALNADRTDDPADNGRIDATPSSSSDHPPTDPRDA